MGLSIIFVYPDDVRKSVSLPVELGMLCFHQFVQKALKSQVTRKHWQDRQIVRKQLDIMPTYQYVQKQGKLMMQSREYGQKPQFGQFFDDFDVKYLQIVNFSEK